MIVTPKSLTQARLLIISAGVFWSLSGIFAKALSKPTVFHVHEPAVHPWTIAFFRVLFAAIALSPLLLGSKPPRRSKALMAMMTCFAMMNALFIAAMIWGTAAGAILLQYTAPLWLLLAGLFWFGEKIDGRDVWLLIGGLTGIGILIVGNWGADNPWAVAAALGSGLTYAGVVLGLRFLRDQPSAWLAVLNFLASAALALPFAMQYPMPSLTQLAWLAAFGLVQLALPYWLMANGLKRVSSFEAGLLTLIEPVLNPLWAFLVSPATETPSIATLIGGAVIVGSLAYRYWPSKRIAENELT